MDGISQSPTAVVSDVQPVLTSAPRTRVAHRPLPARLMRRWRKRLFVSIARNAASAVEYLRLPYKQTITMGWQVPL